jgi:uncharacterized protein (DUF1015 family)
LAEIRPFHGVHYDPSQVKDPAAVICPPWDVIPPQLQQELYGRSPYNFVHVEYGRQLPQDTDADNKFTRAAAAVADWLAKGVLVTDDRPGIYLHDQHFTLRGREYRRRGIVGAVRLEEWASKVVRPHEGIFSSHKDDRLNMLWNVQANTSPVLATFEDGRELISVLEEQDNNKPILEATLNGETHRLRAITDETAIETITACIARQPLYIADGHHRYESALTYRRERRACEPTDKEQPYDFVMMTLVAFDDPGLVILPAHRLARGVAKDTLAGLEGKLAELFTITEVPLDNADITGQAEKLLAEPHGIAIALYGLKPDNLQLLRPRDPAVIGGMMPLLHSDRYRSLSVSAVDHVLLEELLGINPENVGVAIDYSYDAADAVSRVAAGEFQLACIVGPVRPEDVKAIADSGDRMPRKATYFYPKAPSGVVFRRFG